MSLAADPTIHRQVVNAAREILAADPEAPIDRIVKRAGVSRATFYRHFGSRHALLESIAHEPRPKARTRILGAAQEMLVRTSLAELSMDDLARAADVSRGTLYRIFPGKAALMDGLIEEYSPFEAVRAIVPQHRDEPPERRAAPGRAGDRRRRRGASRPDARDVPGDHRGSEAALSGHAAGVRRHPRVVWRST